MSQNFKQLPIQTWVPYDREHLSNDKITFWLLPYSVTKNNTNTVV